MRPSSVLAVAGAGVRPAVALLVARDALAEYRGAGVRRSHDFLHQTRFESVVIQLLFPVIGAVLLVLLATDVLITVFHPQGRGGPINRTQNHWVWVFFRAVGTRRDGSVRSEVLAFCGPILAVLTIATWGMTLITGFVLIYYPFIDSFHVAPFAAGEHSPLVRAIYYSAYTASTLGIGDIVAPTAALRLLTVVESLCGFILIGTSVSYVLAVYRELGTATTLALDISGYFERGAARVWEEASHVRPLAFDGWADRTARALLHVTQAHSQYPILNYFHTGDPPQALLVQLCHLVRFGSVFEGRDPEVVASPSFAVLRHAVRRYLYVINRDVVPKGFDPDYDRLQEAELEAQYRRATRYLLYDRLVASVSSRGRV